MARELTPREREQRADSLERAVSSEAWQAVRHLIKAAMCGERSRDYTDAPIGAEHNLYFLARTICAEYGFDFEFIRADVRNQFIFG